MSALQCTAHQAPLSREELATRLRESEANVRFLQASLKTEQTTTENVASDYENRLSHLTLELLTARDTAVGLEAERDALLLQVRTMLAVKGGTEYDRVVQASETTRNENAKMRTALALARLALQGLQVLPFATSDPERLAVLSKQRSELIYQGLNATFDYASNLAPAFSPRTPLSDLLEDR